MSHDNEIRKIIYISSISIFSSGRWRSYVACTANIWVQYSSFSFDQSFLLSVVDNISRKQANVLSKELVENTLRTKQLLHDGLVFVTCGYGYVFSGCWKTLSVRRYSFLISFFCCCCCSNLTYIPLKILKWSYNFFQCSCSSFFMMRNKQWRLNASMLITPCGHART